MIDLKHKEIEYITDTAPEVLTSGKGSTDFTEAKGNFELGGDLDRNWIFNKFLISKPEYFQDIIRKMKTFNDLKRTEHS